jgi:ferredoxin
VVGNEEDRMKVRIERELCTGDAQCADICPEVFVMEDDGQAYRAAVRAPVVARALEPLVAEAAKDCPGECIVVE